jgi:hypothetical protein
MWVQVVVLVAVGIFFLVRLGLSLARRAGR